MISLAVCFPRRARVIAAVLAAAACDAERVTGPPADAALRAAASPGVPSPISASPGSDVLINVSWTNNSNNETGFEVHRSSTGATGTFTLVTTTAANVTSYADGGRTPLTEYCYKVRVVRQRGNRVTYSDFTAVACATTHGPPPAPTPAAPTNTRAVPWLSAGAAVYWTDASDNETGFRIERSTDGATWATSWNTTSFYDTGLIPEQQVCYRVFAVNGAGESPASNVDCTTPMAMPGSFAAAAGGSGEIQLTWTDNSAVEDGYQLMREVCYGGYYYYYYGPQCYYETIAWLDANATSHLDTGLEPGVSYNYSVVAYRNEDGYTGYSDTAFTSGTSGTPGP